MPAVLKPPPSVSEVRKVQLQQRIVPQKESNALSRKKSLDLTKLTFLDRLNLWKEKIGEKDSEKTTVPVTSSTSTEQQQYQSVPSIAKIMDVVEKNSQNDERKEEDEEKEELFSPNITNRKKRKRETPAHDSQDKNNAHDPSSSNDHNLPIPQDPNNQTDVYNDELEKRLQHYQQQRSSKHNRPLEQNDCTTAPSASIDLTADEKDADDHRRKKQRLFSLPSFNSQPSFSFSVSGFVTSLPKKVFKSVRSLLIGKRKKVRMSDFPSDDEVGDDAEKENNNESPERQKSNHKRKALDPEEIQEETITERKLRRTSVEFPSTYSQRQILEKSKEDPSSFYHSIHVNCIFLFFSLFSVLTKYFYHFLSFFSSGIVDLAVFLV
jgi:hypothetical protein